MPYEPAKALFTEYAKQRQQAMSQGKRMPMFMDTVTDTAYADMLKKFTREEENNQVKQLREAKVVETEKLIAATQKIIWLRAMERDLITQFVAWSDYRPRRGHSFRRYAALTVNWISDYIKRFGDMINYREKDSKH